MSKTTPLYIGSVMLNHWFIPYGIPNTILSGNGPQFVADFWKTVCYILFIRRKKTTPYHRQTNGQAESYNRTITKSLRHYVSEHQINWDLFVQLLAYDYNPQVIESTGTTAFNRTDTRALPCLILDKSTTIAPRSIRHNPVHPYDACQCFETSVGHIRRTHTLSAKTRAKYKRHDYCTVTHPTVFKKGE